MPEAEGVGARYFAVTRVSDGRTERVNAVMGLDPVEVERWPALAAALGADEEGHSPAGRIEALQGDGVFLPAVIQRLLDLKVGDAVLIHGVAATFAGTTDGQALQRLRHVDGESVLPVDFLSEAYGGLEETTSTDEGEEAFASEVQKNFDHFSSDQVAVVGNDLARRLGADLHMVTLYPGPEIEPSQLARDHRDAGGDARLGGGRPGRAADDPHPPDRGGGRPAPRGAALAGRAHHLRDAAGLDPGPREGDLHL